METASKKKTQKEIIKEHLFKYGAITSWEAIQMYRITRLAAIIDKLKKESIVICSKMQYNEQTEKRYARYTLNEQLKMKL